MKKIFTVLILSLIANFSFSQTVVKTVWSSNFENGGLQPPCSDTSNAKDTVHGFDWGITDKYHYNGNYSDSARVHIYDTLYFTTCPFSTVGDTFITVEFQHICKISLFDAAFVQVSNDSGASWHTLGDTQYINTKGVREPKFNLTGLGYGSFNELSYAHVPPTWLPSTVVAPTNTWWEYEYFNASQWLGGTNADSNCMLRFAVVDGPISPGHENYYGWLIDSVYVKSSPCENIKPRGEMANPQIYNTSLLYSLGPFNIYAKLWDENSGFCDAWLVYSVNGGTPDSVSMDSIFPPGTPNTASDSVYRGVIPRIYNGVDSFKGGDSICYWINIYDCSNPCRNQYHLPNDPTDPTRLCNIFYLTNGTKLPYCDNFENVSQSNFWDTTMISGVVGWQLGAPFGYTAHSGTRAWTTVLAGNYSNNDWYTVNSPIFDFTDAITPRISFWHRRNMPTNSSDQDRYRVEYSINGNAWQWLGGAFDVNGKLLNAPNCPSTWYDQTNGFSGQFHNGIWREAFYQLPASFTGQNQVQFRFMFDADANSLNGYGVSFDDFCVYNPPNCDVSVLEIVRPFNDYIKRAGEQDSVMVILRNIGIDTLTSIPMGYLVRDTNGLVTATVSETLNYPHGIYPGGLPPLSIDTFYFSTKFTVPQGLYQIFGYPAIACDFDSSNDTANTRGHFGFLVDTISHFTNFDTLPVKWATTVPDPATCGNPAPPTPNRWEHGTPNFGQTNNAYSPPSSWDLNLTTGYDNGAFEVLYSNMFDMTNADSAFLSFWHNRNTAYAEDGYYIDFSFNRFQTFARLNATTQPIGRKINWSNSYPPLYSNFGPGWSGLTLNWEYSQCPLNNVNFRGKSEVMFRFVFRSSPTTVLDGVSIDDFRIVNPDTCDAEMFDFVLPTRGCVMDIAEPVEIVVKNTGKGNLNNTPVAYKYRFSPGCSGTYGGWIGPFSDTIFTTMQPALTYTHRFQDSVNMSVFGCYEFCVWTESSCDKNNGNDTLCGIVVENVRGCDVDFKITTGSTNPNGDIIFQDSATLDTLWLQPLTAIGPNAIQWGAEVCLYEAGTYKFSITSTDTTMITWWRLRDPFGDSTILTGIDPGVKYFFWKCPPLLSASAEKITPFGSSPLPIPQTYQFNVRTRNRGSVKLSYLWLTLDIYRDLPTSLAGPILNYTDSIYFGFPGDEILFPRLNLMDTTWAAEPGKYTICAWTSLPNGNADSATYDDTVCLDFVVLDTVSSLPYCNNFDSDAIQPPWGSMSKTSYDVSLSTWKLGAPSQSHINSAKSNPRAWMTELDKNYPYLDSSGLYSPEFEVDTSNCYKFSFDHNFKTEHAFDGGTVEYTLDSGRTWKVVGGKYNTNDTCYPLSTNNWYNTPYVTGLVGMPNPPGWSSIAGTGWRSSFRDIKFPDVGQNPIKVVFRFRFGADASIQDEGWAVDNFCLDATGNCIYYCCFDGIKNGDEDSVDCGGSCVPCPSCFDGIQNQNEQDIDCGGVCDPCPSCVDGILNGNETQPDCGGPDCAPCPDCNDGIRTLNWKLVSAGPPQVWAQYWEKGVDCGKPACPEECWVGIDDVDPNILFLGQAIPNPASDEVTIAYQIPYGGEATVIIRSVLGREMYRSTKDEAPGIFNVKLDVSSWSEGVYYTTLEFGGEQLVEKLVVQRK